MAATAREFDTFGRNQAAVFAATNVASCSDCLDVVSGEDVQSAQPAQQDVLRSPFSDYLQRNQTMQCFEAIRCRKIF